MIPFVRRGWLCRSACVLALAWGAPQAYAVDPAPPPLLLAEVLRGDVDVSRYWVSEKLDGARAVWDGHSLRFRSGRPVHAPAWFIAGLPAEPLDGELWIARGRFEDLSGIVRRQVPRDADWRQVKFMVFEQPDGAGSFTERIARLRAIVATANGIEPESVELLGDLATRFGIGIADPWSRYLNVAYNHPHRVANMDVATAVFGRADVIVFLEADVPWMETHTPPPADTYIAQVGVDPLYSTYPIRSHRSDLNISATSAAFLTRLAEELEKRSDSIDLGRSEGIRAMAAVRQGRIDEQRRQETEGDDDAPITAAAISAVLGDLLEEDDIVVNEYVSTACLLNRTQPGTYFFLPASGGLGWGLPAALGAQYAAPDRTVIATLGDGAYMFANPAACHHAAAKHNLPVLTILANNSNWWAVDMATQLVYPEGEAVASAEGRFSDLSPSPDFASYCTASGGYGVTVHRRSELAAALKEALRVVRVERRQALVDVRTK